MNLFRHFRDRVLEAVESLAAAGDLPAGLDTRRIAVEPPRDPAHGDVTTNAALVLAKPARMNPRHLAERLAAHLEALDDVARCEVAEPAFLNLRLERGFWGARLREVLAAGAAYGDCDIGAGQKINVEYVSANPTGPLHIGHARGAVVGDALAALLEKAGYDVTREYYVNDAGAQIDALARSLYEQYKVKADAGDDEALQRLFESGALQYGGDYLIPTATEMARVYSGKWVAAPEGEWLPAIREIAIKDMMELIRGDLDSLGVHFDFFASERELVEAGAVDAAIAALEERGLVYTGVLEPPKGKLPDDWEPREQTLFRATDFGDDVDRPVRKSDGSWTYFATDMAYHLNKFERGFDTMIDVWGADHAGYVKRVQAAVAALTEGRGALDVKVCRLVNLLDDGVPVKMSKRAGAFVTLREVVDRVGRDVVRFIMLTRTNDVPLDFDFARVVEKTRDNPVFYVHYAHARIRSVMRNATEIVAPSDLTPEALAQADLGRLTDLGELDVIKRLAAWPRVVEGAAEAHEPHRIANYLNDLAAAFHMQWNKGNDDPSLRIIIAEDRDLTAARLALAQGVAFVIASGLAVFGVTPAEELR